MIPDQSKGRHKILSRPSLLTLAFRPSSVSPHRSPAPTSLRPTYIQAGNPRLLGEGRLRPYCYCRHLRCRVPRHDCDLCPLQNRRHVQRRRVRRQHVRLRHRH